MAVEPSWNVMLVALQLGDVRWRCSGLLYVLRYLYMPRFVGPILLTINGKRLIVNDKFQRANSHPVLSQAHTSASHKNREENL